MIKIRGESHRHRAAHLLTRCEPTNLPESPATVLYPAAALAIMKTSAAQLAGRTGSNHGSRGRLQVLAEIHGAFRPVAAASWASKVAMR
jgi:hypothetical protein